MRFDGLNSIVDAFYKSVYVLPSPIVFIRKHTAIDFIATGIREFLIGYSVGIEIIIKVDRIYILSIDHIQDDVADVVPGSGNPGVKV